MGLEAHEGSWKNFRKYKACIFPVCWIWMKHRETQTQMPGCIWPTSYLFAAMNLIQPHNLIQEETEAQKGKVCQVTE